MQSPRYPIHLHWSEEDGEWVPTSPAWPALSALAQTPGAAGAQLDEAIQIASSANAELGRPVPESLTVAEMRTAVLVISGGMVFLANSVHALDSLLKTWTSRLPRGEGWWGFAPFAKDAAQWAGHGEDEMAVRKAESVMETWKPGPTRPKPKKTNPVVRCRI